MKKFFSRTLKKYFKQWKTAYGDISVAILMFFLGKSYVIAVIPEHNFDSLQVDIFCTQ